VPIYINLSEVLANSERPQARQKVMRDAVRLAPRDPNVQTELGLAETGARDFAAAERAFREAIRLSPGFTSAYLELGLLLENLNRIDELATLAEEAEARGVSGPELSFIKAWSLRRQGRSRKRFPMPKRRPPRSIRSAAPSWWRK
jgi:tetratricopeptide (TPR) repeat protein